MLALLLALAWVPLTSHCQIESASGLEFLRCAAPTQSSPLTPDHCEDAGCCATEKGHCQAPSLQQLTPRPLSALLPLHLAPAAAAPTLSVPRARPVPDTAPPGLAATWQFISRTALPARAPSLLP